MNKYFLLFCLSILSLQLKAQDTIYTDRPTVTYSPQTIKKNHFQIETGFHYLSQDLSALGNGFEGNRLMWINWNELLLRYGVSEKVELRFGQYLREYRYRPGTSFENGFVQFAPTSFGVKWSILSDKSVFPDLSLLFNLSGPVFEKGDSWSAETKLLFSSTLFKTFILDYNIGYRLQGSADMNDVEYSVVLSRMVNPRLKAFVESFGFFTGNHTEQHNFDLGLTYLINNTLQADAYVGSGFNGDSAQLIFGFGVSKLFLPKQ